MWRDISLSGYIFTRLRLVKIWTPAREISHTLTHVISIIYYTLDILTALFVH
jgi:hypothetical protein